MWTTSGTTTNALNNNVLWNWRPSPRRGEGWGGPGKPLTDWILSLKTKFESSHEGHSHPLGSGEIVSTPGLSLNNEGSNPTGRTELEIAASHPQMAGNQAHAGLPLKNPRIPPGTFRSSSGALHLAENLARDEPGLFNALEG